MTLVVAAHPDDEVIGAGAQLPRLAHAFFIHVTDGAPRDMRDATLLGLETREAYAALRRRELIRALAVAGIDAQYTMQLGCVDQEAAFNLRDLTWRMFNIFQELQPRTVFTHPYEGGHPDHDATAFACHAAARLIKKRGKHPPTLFEFTSYHARDGHRVEGEFLPAKIHTDVMTFRLKSEQQQLKRQLYDCFESQKKVLAGFPIGVERFRLAPRYDFTTPPHEGKLYYENFPWGIHGDAWRTHAREILSAFDIE
jgi:LmbE family N-acetylglucosaminyl deacetylase